MPTSQDRQMPQWPPVERSEFGLTPEGLRVERVTLRNPAGIEVDFISMGGIITSIRLPDRNGSVADVALGYDTLDEYRSDSSYFGALVGRCANRIARGKFTLDGEEYTLACNNGPNHLHGGVRGFNQVVWVVEPFEHPDGVGAVLSTVSEAGDEGYPGTLTVRVTYTLSAAGELAVDYWATTDAPTPVNLTQHSYFNLAGDGSGQILDHELTLVASEFTPIDATLIPTGERASVAGTPFDFRRPTAIGARIGDEHEQLRHGGGYDHNFVLDRAASDGGATASLAARLFHPASGRAVDVYTTEPGIQFYSGNFLGNGLTGKGGREYAHRSGLALETQHFPDSPNQPHFPSVILRPGQEFRSRTVYHFSVRA